MSSFLGDAYGQFLALQTGLFGGPIETPLPVAIAEVVTFFFYGNAAAVLTVFFIYAAMKWIANSDNPEEIQKARKIITTALVGFGITAFAYIILALHKSHDLFYRPYGNAGPRP